MKTASLNYALALALVAITCGVCIVHPAFAQVAGGGAQGFVTWATSAQGFGGLIGLFIGLVGLLLMFGQHSWVGLGMAVAGGVLFANSTQIGTFFSGG